MNKLFTLWDGPKPDGLDKFDRFLSDVADVNEVGYKSSSMGLGVRLNTVQSECKRVGSVFECDMGNTSSGLCSKEEHPNEDIDV